MRWNGRSWAIQKMAVPKLTLNGAGYRVSCPATHVCFSAMTDRYIDRVVIERWAHGVWSIMHIPPHRGSLTDISCTEATFCVVVGSAGRWPLVERWNGKHWSVQHVPRVGLITSVSCTSKRRCMAVGTARPKDKQSLPVMVWNGSRWRLLPTRIVSRGFLSYFVGGSVFDLSCTGIDACVAVGGWSSYCTSLPRPGPCSQGGLWWQWDGYRWTIGADGSQHEIERVSCLSGSWCMAVAQGVIKQWDGSRWTRMHGVNDAVDVSCSSEKACTAVGFRYFFSDVTGDNYVPEAWHWNGHQWTRLTRL